MISWEWWALWVVAPLVVGTVVVAIVATRRRTPTQGMLSKTESWIVSVIGAGAMLVSVFAAITVVGSGIQQLTDDPLWVPRMPYSGSPVERLSGLDAVSGSGYESVWLEVDDLPGAARWLLYAEASLPALATLAIGVTIAWLAITLIRERPFTRALPHAMGVAAIAVMVAGIGSQVAGSIGRSLVVEHLGAKAATTATGANGEALAYMTLGLDLSPIGWALGLALVAAAFQIGVRMQKDTEALV